MPRRFLVSLVAGLLAFGMAVPSASAQDEFAKVFPCVDFLPPWTADAGQPIRLGCGWSTQGGPGKLVSLLNSYSGALTIRDEEDNVVLRIEPKEFAGLWGAPAWFWRVEDPDIRCAGPQGAVIWWFYWLEGGLPAGTYELTFTETYAHPVTDGFHTCWFREDGSRLVSPPNQYVGTAVYVSTLVVE